MLWHKTQGAGGVGDKSWSLEYATETGVTFSLYSQDSGPRGIFFKPDGTKMYMCGYSSDAVHQYDLSTAWDISTLSFVKSQRISTYILNPSQISFKPDGTKMYALSPSGRVQEYTLATPWDIGVFSMSANPSSYYQITYSTTPYGLFFKPDGTKMYIGGQSLSDVIEYNLSTAWDITTASYLRDFSTAANGSMTPNALFFKPDGTKMYVGDENGREIREYELNTPWNIDTASPGFLLTLSGYNGPTSISFKEDGIKMFVQSSYAGNVLEFSVE